MPAAVYDESNSYKNGQAYSGAPYTYSEILKINGSIDTNDAH